jgi:hypothetical protein
MTKHCLASLTDNFPLLKHIRLQSEQIKKSGGKLSFETYFKLSGRICTKFWRRGKSLLTSDIKWA